MSESMILKLEGIKKNFGGVKALKGVNFELRRGEVHALLGENGAGKSTLIKILTGVYKPDGGDILLKGEKISIANPIDARNKGIAAIYQELSLIESLTVAENIYLGIEPTITPAGVCNKKKLYEDADAFLNRFGIRINSHAKVSSLGLGQKRIIEIVKALAINAEILLLDEPTTGMSKAEIDTLFEIMKSLKEKNVTMIYISHYLDEVFRCCDRSTVFRDGANVDSFKMDKVTTAELVHAMIGRSVERERYRPVGNYEDAPVSVEAKNFRSSGMAKPLSFRAHAGEILGFTGIVGAGKSELALSLFGGYRQTEGELFFNGEKVEMKSPYEAHKHKIALIPEDRKSQGLLLQDTIEDNIALVNQNRIKNKVGLQDRRKRFMLANVIGEQMKLSPMNVRMKAGNLSGGNQQKVVLGKWLAGNPDVLLMDEPTRGIDVGAKAEIYRFIVQLANEGKTVIVFSSEFEELQSTCDRIMVLCKGEIAGEMSAADATAENMLTLALGGTQV